MNSNDPREAWLRGPVEGIPPLLQPIAHALIQSLEEAQSIVSNLPAAQLWVKPAGLASVGFHLRHLAGVLDRLFTYARGEALSARQLAFLEGEGTETLLPSDLGDLLRAFETQVSDALSQLAATRESSLADSRFVGRKKMASTVGGLLFHAAEHTQRHIGQLLVTVRVLLHYEKKPPGI